MNILVSVLMPAYNVEKTIEQSIYSLLNQTYENFELIIVDDGSTDRTVDIIQSFNDDRIKLFRNKQNMKIAKTLNICINNAKGKYFARSDADDINMPQRLQVQLKYLENHPDVDVVGSDIYIIDPNGKIKGGLNITYTDHDGLVRNIHWRSPPLGHATIMAKGSWFKKYRYREEYFRTEDADLFLRSYSDSKFANIPKYLYAERDPGSLNINKLFHANWQSIIRRIRHFKEYNIPIYKVVLYPIYMTARINYYFLTAIVGSGIFWGKLKNINIDINYKKDQEWIYFCMEKSSKK